MLIAHISIAVFSLIFTAYSLFTPSKNKLKIGYLLTVFTFVTGGYLVAKTPAHMLQTCTTGLVYLGAMLAGLSSLRHKIFGQQYAFEQAKEISRGSESEKMFEK